MTDKKIEPTPTIDPTLTVGDRGAVNDGRRKVTPEDDQRRGRLLFGAGIALALGVLGFMAFQNARTVEIVETKKVSLPPVMETTAATMAQPPALPVGFPTQQPIGQKLVVIKQSETEIVYEAAQRAPLSVFVGDGWANVGSRGDAAAGGRDGNQNDEAPLDKGSFEARLRAPRLRSSRAALMGDLRFIVPEGTSISCVLETALQSDQPGFTTCVIPHDVWSANNQVVLLEAGTKVIGQYRGGLTLGQTRLHVLWTSARTPMGVRVELDSPGTDGLGRAGFGGEVDNHFRERFSSAILRSIVADASALGSQQLQAQGIKANSSSGAGNNAAGLATEESSAIKPTLHKNQGEVVSIYVARDLDMSSVYGVRVDDGDGGSGDRGRGKRVVRNLK